MTPKNNSSHLMDIRDETNTKPKPKQQQQRNQTSGQRQKMAFTERVAGVVATFPEAQPPQYDVADRRDLHTR